MVDRVSPRKLGTGIKVRGGLVRLSGSRYAVVTDGICLLYSPVKS
jgi:hypothetical protein